MIRFLYLTLLLAGISAFVFTSCQKAPELTLNGPTSIELSADGSKSTFTFTANRDWTVRASDSWVIVSPSSGTATDGLITVTVSCAANTTYEDRTATVTIKMEELTQTVSVRQPANLGIILPTQSFELASDARSLEVTVQSNVQYSVVIDGDWIKQKGTKGLITDKLTFDIEENKTYDAREGKITIKSENSSVADQVVRVRQAQKDALIVKDSSFDMPYGGGEIEIKVEANVEFDVTPNVEWIQYLETKALSNSTIRLSVAENETYSSREGKIEITQKNGSLKHTVKVKQAGRVAVTSVTLNKTELRIKEGDSETLEATVKPDNATDKTVTWSSSDENVATVDEGGKITAIKAGTANITATAGEKSAKCVVTVYKEIPVTSITLDHTTLSLAAGDEVSLKATVKPDDATDKTITWTSSDTSIATVDSEGKVTAISKGSATITASSWNVSASCKVYVKAASYPTPSGSVDLGLSVVWAEKNLGATSAYDTGGYYLWGDPTGTGVIMYFDTPNTNYICDTQYDIARAQLGKGWRLPTREEINELLSSCKWETVTNGVRLTGPNGNSVILPLTGMAYPADGPIGSTSISGTSKGYMMSGESKGDSYGRFAYVYYYDQSFSYNWTSYNAPMAKFPVRPVFESLDGSIPVSSITLNQTELTLKKGDSETLVVTVSPDDATDKTITWTSNNNDVVTVESGVIKGVGIGTAVVTATAGTVSATCNVTVLSDSADGVYARYLGGAISSINGVIQQGSQLNFGVYNYSTEDITVVSAQLINGQTGNAGNVMTINSNIASGNSAAWAITIGAGGIQSPRVRFVYQFKGEEYTCEAYYQSYY